MRGRAERTDGMTRYGTAKIAAVLALLAVTILPKVTTYLGRPDNALAGLASIERFAAETGLAIESVRQTTAGVHVNVRNGDCSALIKEVAPQGGDIYPMRIFADDRPLLFVYRGTIYDAQPAWRTWFDYRLRRVLMPFGIDVGYNGVFGVAYDPACARSDIPWARLSG